MKYGLGIFGREEPGPLVVEHIKNCLQDGKKVRKLLKHRKDVVCMQSSLFTCEELPTYDCDGK
jgi:hypothetical protein